MVCQRSPDMHRVRQKRGPLLRGFSNGTFVVHELSIAAKL